MPAAPVATTAAKHAGRLRRRGRKDLAGGVALHRAHRRHHVPQAERQRAEQRRPEKRVAAQVQPEQGAAKDQLLGQGGAQRDADQQFVQRLHRAEMREACVDEELARHGQSDTGRHDGGDRQDRQEPEAEAAAQVRRAPDRGRPRPRRCVHQCHGQAGGRQVDGHVGGRGTMRTMSSRRPAQPRPRRSRPRPRRDRRGSTMGCARRHSSGLRLFDPVLVDGGLQL